ncbi:proteophosphoglycan 5 [Rhodotorula toruloides]|uniref:Proteophosphoglycan 5 n=1 Tax=Rhodotorula toruloides TaxID=5286 RepID=A0A511KM81_RHOTO|nr:proteophosphoglycan 5 [Rhodotorula toruloides]
MKCLKKCDLGTTGGTLRIAPVTGGTDGIVRAPLPAKRTARRKASVVIHARWGGIKSRLGFESATKNATLCSVPLAAADPTVEKLASCHDLNLDVHVSMKDGAKDLFPRSHPYNLHDGQDVKPLNKLREIAFADVHLTATGVFTSLVHWSAGHGLFIVPVH